MLCTAILIMNTRNPGFKSVPTQRLTSCRKELQDKYLKNDPAPVKLKGDPSKPSPSIDCYEVAKLNQLRRNG